ncbi:Protein jagunal-like protein 1-A [Trichoplax sp. H2]|uniref:Uncharacterized protein n=1 Tax=Trichoplax adhaerens TaxID=10228 RepID=B3RY75_TRIAD|nr:hypothetical protein TRIADDRAFT_56462 [Trichoplax adhaerens]EDV24985.1 hypothetical protein TRIADDRAFT_56462 [Trichoplax adhaerens]RDD45871.1 Protein jagunal-like protein 1-A [Trichoplax sp. H2]|eukprot:XP_002112875.1 hypothetical protein TRIADDRAFT_56462 [Trichoplax adhaerens]
MASRGHHGNIKGSDGSDWKHRERVADHYKRSVEYKSSYSFFTDIYMILLVGVIVVEYILPYALTQSINASLWQHIWLLSIVPVLIGRLALSRNNSGLMILFIFGTLCLGLGPLIAGARDYGFLMYRRINDRTPSDVKVATFAVFGTYSIILRCSFIVIAFIVHILSLRTGAKLCGVWRTKKLD